MPTRAEIVEEIRAARILLDMAWPPSENLSTDKAYIETIMRMQLLPHILQSLREETLRVQRESLPAPRSLEDILQTVRQVFGLETSPPVGEKTPAGIATTPHPSLAWLSSKSGTYHLFVDARPKPLCGKPILVDSTYPERSPLDSFNSGPQCHNCVKLAREQGWD